MKRRALRVTLRWAPRVRLFAVAVAVGAAACSRNVEVEVPAEPRASATSLAGPKVPEPGPRAPAAAVSDGDATTPVEVLSPGAPVSIAVLGSSTASGKNLTKVGSKESESWVGRYAAFLAAERPGSRVSNLAVAGYGTWEALPTGSTNAVGAPAPDPAHNISAALALRPHAVIVNYPSGDVMDGWSVEQVMGNLETIERTALAAGVRVWVTTSQPAKGATGDKLARLVEQRDLTLRRFGARALDFWTPLATPDGSTRPELLNDYDKAHPNAEGQRVLFETVEQARIPLALERSP